MKENKKATQRPIWTPTEEDRQWTRRVLALVKDGGTWVVPLNESIYRVDQKNKILTLLCGIQLDPTAIRIEQVCKEIGWTVLYPENN